MKRQRTHYVIRLPNGETTEVTPEVYREYYRMARRERYLEERDRAHGVVSLDALSDHTMAADRYSEIEEKLMREWFVKKLHQELETLSPWDKRMMRLTFCMGCSIAEAAEIIGCSRKKITDHQQKVFQVLRKRFEAEGIYDCSL